MTEAAWEMSTPRPSAATTSDSLSSSLVDAANALDPDYTPPVQPNLLVERYYNNPRAFIEDCFEWPPPTERNPSNYPSEYQFEFGDALIVHSRLSIRGPHGLGKTAFASWLVIWFYITSEAAQVDWKCLQTASVWRQMSKFLWPEIKKWLRKVRWSYLNSLLPASHPPFIPPRDKRELLDTALNGNWGEAFAVVSTDHEKIEGAHAKRILFVYDESKAIPPKTWDASEGAFSNAGPETGNEAYLFSISTPGEPAGRFFDIQSRKKGYKDWYIIHVTLQAAISAGRISQSWADNRLAQWGQSSQMYQNRVLGEFCVDASSGIVPMAWIEAANNRYLELEEADLLRTTIDPITHSRYATPLARLSCDVARSGEDDTVYARRYGRVTLPLTAIPTEHKDNTMYVTGILAGIFDSVGGETEAVIDVNGLGAGVFDRLREQGWNCWGFVAQARSELTDLSGELGFTNRRSEAWWGMRELLDPRNSYDIALPPDDRLLGELTAPGWRITSGGKIQVEAKEDVKKRLGFSTDYADTVIMLHATRYLEEVEGIVTHDERVTISPF